MNFNNQQTSHHSDDMIFVLDIGTRSIIGLAGIVENDRINVLAIDSAEHTKRAMIDGQIEDISSVAKLAASVKEKIEAKLGTSLTKVSVAAAGRALKTERATHEIDVPDGKAIDDDLINQLESGAIEKIEFTLGEAGNDAYKHFNLVGYSVVQYYLDDYPMSSLSDHHGSKIKADILATFLPSEVVDSLYSAMEQAGLEVASMTLEPIAAINAAIPSNLRLLNLAFADIGAGTSDIAVCKDGNIVGYTMTTTAGDEITETLMKEYLVDFDTAEQIKMDLDSKKEIYFTDVMGFEQTVSADTVQEVIADCLSILCNEIAQGICEVNGGAPSAVFLAGGGSKLSGVLEGVRDALNMDEKRIGIAGSNFKTTAFSKEYDLNDPELATPLGIAVSTGLNLINDSYHLTLNGKRARLFRNGQLNVLNVLTMNGYRYRDLFGRSGSSLILTVNGKRTVFYGEPATTAVLTLNGEPATASDFVTAGDILEFIPAKAGKSAEAKVSDVVGDNAENLVITVNGVLATPETELNSGDIIYTAEKGSSVAENVLTQKTEVKAETKPEPQAESAAPEISEPQPKPENPVISDSQPVLAIEEIVVPESEEVLTQASEPEPEEINESAPLAEPQPFVAPKKTRRTMTVLDRPPGSANNSETVLTPLDAHLIETPKEKQNPEFPAEPAEEIPQTRTSWHFTLNDKPVTFPVKPGNTPYLLLDMLQHSGLDFDNLTSPVILAVNGKPGTFQQELKDNDLIIIKQDE